MTKEKPIQYDYENQAWVFDGHYLPCGHIGSTGQMECECYGRLHAGEPVASTAILH